MGLEGWKGHAERQWLGPIESEEYKVQRELGACSAGSRLSARATSRQSNAKTAVLGPPPRGVASSTDMC